MASPRPATCGWWSMSKPDPLALGSSPWRAATVGALGRVHVGARRLLWISMRVSSLSVGEAALLAIETASGARLPVRATVSAPGVWDAKAPFVGASASSMTASTILVELPDSGAAGYGEALVVRCLTRSGALSADLLLSWGVA